MLYQLRSPAFFLYEKWDIISLGDSQNFGDRGPRRSLYKHNWTSPFHIRAFAPQRQFDKHDSIRNIWNIRHRPTL